MSLEAGPADLAHQDARDLYRAIRTALDAGVHRDAVSSAVSAVLSGECGEAEAATILRRLAKKRGRRKDPAALAKLAAALLEAEER